MKKLNFISVRDAFKNLRNDFLNLQNYRIGMNLV